ncbi:F-box LRR-repeat protein [Tieghemiomyces parasiticus]|uniref:F-box LRR-repeat protein n=1 Tax=Tieghemiomyces parasiticus TaxID=78921 RepID=A0A9W8A9B5_9FUNG|nr:F-box LRR-repeat protein [Tieghemiomyces parasiticus]
MWSLLALCGLTALRAWMACWDCLVQAPLDLTLRRLPVYRLLRFLGQLWSEEFPALAPRWEQRSPRPRLRWRPAPVATLPVGPSSSGSTFACAKPFPATGKRVLRLVPASKASRHRVTYRFHRPATTIRDLPPEVLAGVFDHLSQADRTRCARVNREWHIIATAALRGEALVYPVVTYPDAHWLVLHSLYRWILPARIHAAAHRWLRYCPVPWVGFLAGLPLLDGAGLPAAWCLRAYGHLVRKVDLSPGRQLLGDLALDRIAHYCPGLRDLNLTGCTQFSPAALRSLAAACPRLRTLSLSDCPQVDDITFLAILAACPGLRQLGLTHNYRLTDRALLTIPAAHLRSLRRLRLTGCTGLTGRGLTRLLTLTHQLTWLDLSHLPLLTTPVIHAISRSCPGLERVSLAHSGAGLHPDVAHYLDPHGRPPHELLTYHPDSVGDAAVLALVTRCPRLRVLDLNYVHTVSNLAVEHIASRAHALVSLSIVGCVNVDHRALAALTRLRQRSGRLVCVTLGDAPGITEESIAELALAADQAIRGWQRSVIDERTLASFMAESFWT